MFHDATSSAERSCEKKAHGNSNSLAIWPKRNAAKNRKECNCCVCVLFCFFHFVSLFCNFQFKNADRCNGCFRHSRAFLRALQLISTFCWSVVVHTNEMHNARLARRNSKLTTQEMKISKSRTREHKPPLTGDENNYVRVSMQMRIQNERHLALSLRVLNMQYCMRIHFFGLALSHTHTLRANTIKCNIHLHHKR